MKRSKSVFLSVILLAVWAVAASCQTADTINPAAKLIEEGNTCYANKQYPEALSAYAKAAKADPNSEWAALAYYERAKTFKEMGKDAEAVSECSKSIAVDPLMNIGIAYLLRGFLYEKTGDYRDAFADYSKVLIINPKDKIAAACRDEILLKAYAEFTSKGLAAFDAGLNAYNGKDARLANKKLNEALSCFADARIFDTGAQTSSGMTNLTKGFLHQIIARGVLDAMKPADSKYVTLMQLSRAYYTLSVANAYYERALSILKYEKFINYVNERKGINDQDMAMARDRFAKLDNASANYIRAIDLEARCVANFDAAGELIAANDQGGARRLLGENDTMAAELKNLKASNAEGISSLSGAYAKLNTILSRPLSDAAWAQANKASLEGEIAAYISDLQHAKSSLANVELLNSCSELLKNGSALQKTAGKIGK